MKQAIVVVCVILVLAVIGGIAYIHFIYLPQVAVQDQNVVQTTTTPTTPTSAPAIPSTSTPAITMPLIPVSLIAKTTVYLSANEKSGVNGIDFKVNALTADQLNVTINNTKTGQSQIVAFTVNNPVAVLGYNMTVTSIKQVSYGTVNGQPTYTEQATLSYH